MPEHDNCLIIALNASQPFHRVTGSHGGDVAQVQVILAEEAGCAQEPGSKRACHAWLTVMPPYVSLEFRARTQCLT